MEKITRFLYALSRLSPRGLGWPLAGAIRALLRVFRK